MFSAQRIPYQQTGAFSKIVLDYLEGAASLSPFYEAHPTIDGIKELIARKQKQSIDRSLLVATLNEQYKELTVAETVNHNIALLAKETTFTICTAHQPNLFTGPLYFIYKILHAIKLASELKKQLPEYDFVPVYYMGSEDADFAELNHFTVEGKKYEWTTSQTGAVGRMVVDKNLLSLLDTLEGQVSIYPYGKEWIDKLRSSFKEGVLIQQATLKLVHSLFSSYGLIVLIADHPLLKATMNEVFEEDLFLHTPSQIVSDTGIKLSEHYNEQAHVREINLFYLQGSIRERIEQNGDKFIVHNTDITFTASELKEELKAHPERFSPNVILRGLYQESILPNIVFIGGGGEIAYWLQLKDLFKQFNVPFPVLVLRNSFLILEKSWQQKIEKLGLSLESIFQSSDFILNTLVKQRSSHDLALNGKLASASALYDAIYEQAQSVDPTLARHVAAIKKQALDRLQELEKKMLRAEKRKFAEQKQQIEAIKNKLFPKNGLQERVDNIGYYFSRWGQAFIHALYEHSLGLEQEFVVLKENS